MKGFRHTLNTMNGLRSCRDSYRRFDLTDDFVAFVDKKLAEDD